MRILLSERSEAPGIHERVAERERAVGGDLDGPEGGWTDGEVALAGAAGYKEASLGQFVLRTETAVVAAFANLNFALDGR